MGLFDSIRRVVGRGQSAADDGSDPSQSARADESRSALVATRDLDLAALRERADDVAGEVEQLDFSLASLSQFDAAIDGGYDEELATSPDAGLYATDTVRFGCYLGEVLVRQRDGEWTRDPDWGVTVTGPEGRTTVAVFEVAERSITGESVFADVADRAAAEVGTDAEPSGGGDADSGTADADSGTADADSGTADADESSTAPEPDRPAADTATASEPAVDDTESLIEEAEPADAEPAADGDPEPSLFDDGSAGPTAADAPSADEAPAVPDREGEPTGDDLRDVYAEEAAELVSFWGEYDLDYTPASLARLDALVSDEWDDERFDDAEFGSEETFDDRVFTSVSTELGSYFGELLIRELGAEWSEATATDAVVVERGDGRLAIPVFKVAGTSIKERPVFERSYESLLSDLDGA